MVLIKIVLVISLLGFCSGIELRQNHPDVGLNVKKLIKKYGYPLESHTIITEDGYKLETHRIPYGGNNSNTNVDNRPVVFLMPGLLCSSADWVNMGPETSLGFILADLGYDVWLGNPRGVTWSKKHVSLSARRNEKEFFDFSFHEIGYYDVPANIDYILNITGESKLFYVGHSQGTTTFFVMASSRPEYNDKIRFMGAFAPVAYTENMPNILFPIVQQNIKQIEDFIEKNELYEFMAHSTILSLISRQLCNDDSPFQNICAGVFYFISGYSPHLNKTMIPVITTNTPAGSSSKQFLHFVQAGIAKKFQQYDHGEAENMIKYGQATPPLYDLSKITAPVGLYYSKKDLLSSEIDVEHTASEMSNVVVQYLMQDFNHLDYLWAQDVVPLLYMRLIHDMSKY